MTPADVQALLEKWRQRERFYLARENDCLERNYDPGGFVNNAKADSFKRCADELEPVIQALEALRDEMRDRVKLDGPLGEKNEIEDWADRLDVLLRGAGGQEKENAE